MFFHGKGVRFSCNSGNSWEALHWVLGKMLWTYKSGEIMRCLFSVYQGIRTICEYVRVRDLHIRLLPKTCY